MPIYHEKYVRFDWAMKRLLRDKASHAVIEGLLFTLLGRKVRIERFLESEGNQEDELDKFNRVDILAEDTNGELIIIEIQNSHELTYFHRMLYGVSKAITEYIGRGDGYDHVRKVYSINIVYFELGQGCDYVYHGTTRFVGIHEPHDLLRLSARQSKRFLGVSPAAGSEPDDASRIFPEYYILRVNDFDKVATTPLDEWMEFLKTGNISDDTRAAGLPEARHRLRIDSLPDKERHAYDRYMESVRHMNSIIESTLDKGYGLGHKKANIENAQKMKADGLDTAIIAKYTSLDAATIESL